MDIDVCIPYYDKGKNSNELRFALRSIEKYLSGYGRIWLVCKDLPPWIHHVGHIVCADSSDQRRHEHNIFRKCLAAWENPDVSENVLHFHTDHYLLQPYVAGEFPYYTHRTLLEGALQNEGAYRTTLIRTDKLLRGMLLQTKDFDCHCPIVYHKSKFLRAFERVTWPDYGYGIKSVYCGYNGIEGSPCTDLKITGRKSSSFRERIEGRGWFSTGNSNPMIEQFLASLFPLKSKWEK